MTRILRWQDPPTRWVEGAPIGNGRLGAMVLGGPEVLHLQVNDGTVWSGRPDAWRAELDALVEAGAGPEALEEVRAAIRDDRLDDAYALLMGFEGTYSQEFLPYLDFRARIRGDGSTPTYRGRRLDLHNALYEERTDHGHAEISSRAWASRPDQAIHVEIRANEGTFDVDLELTTRLRELARAVSDEGLEVTVEVPVDGAPQHEPQVDPAFRWREDPVRPGHPADGYEDSWDPIAVASLAIATDGRTVPIDGALRVTGARVVRVTLASSSSAEDWFAQDPELPDRAAHVRRARGRSRTAILRASEAALDRHRDDIRPLLAGCELRLAGTPDEVIVDRLASDADDAAVVPALFQYGRYLLASASRETGPAVNLQGLWNDDIRPAWSSNYTTNINVQMHYWGAETTALAPTVEPLVHLLEVMAKTGEETARRLYGVEGWVGHHNTDLWGWPLPVGMGHSDTSWAIWMTGGTWLTTHLMEHYRFTQDDEWLRTRAWPVMRGAAAFALDWLIDDGGPWLTTNPSTSPENHFVNGDGVSSLDRATAIDRALIGQVLDDVVEAAAAVDLDDPLVDRARAARRRIRPDVVGTDGRIMEWSVDKEDPEPAHGHFSALVGVYPLARIDVDRDPQLARAAAAFISSRKHPASGWPWSWSIALRARLRDAEAAYAIMHEKVVLPDDPDLRGAGEWAWGGLVPTFLGAKRPFQVDVSLGFPAAVAEMLLQSHAGEIHLLPALPAAWAEGEIRGLRARGGFAVDLEWADGRPVRVSISRLAGSGSVAVRFGDRVVTVELAAGERIVLDGSLQL